ncbi:nucleotide exchange factor GrpE [Microbulbifer rhizosphaerae]|uniref:Molecular chaperone GrpE (Heat shock protein) n=1 Tax=Microbulbifer rhizosphaerae TaxID=1562603 RepID=A0A7W4WCF9_9GAMM|nr:nucleotide exchange factor GrpE [Microbulbifer rhizosphaerae]MBB3061698.1 molecular chaperone GrpE (heat shock protein) [Microbulbifer rhizosphaerae]
MLEQFAEQKKGLRRMSLAQKQQGEALEQLSQQLLSLKSTLQLRNGIIFSQGQVIDLLDRLQRIRTAASADNAVVQLTDQAIDQMQQLASLHPLVCQGQHYPAQGCEVLSAMPDSGRAPGTVCEIIQQGYLRETGELIRPAKVVVSSRPTPVEESSSDI